MKKIKKDAQRGVNGATEEDEELGGFHFSKVAKSFQKAKYVDLDALNEEAVIKNQKSLQKLTKQEAQKDMEENLEYLYEERQKKIDQLREKAELKKQKKEKKNRDAEFQPIDTPQNTKWFDRDIFKQGDAGNAQPKDAQDKDQNQKSVKKEKEKPKFEKKDKSKAPEQIQPKNLEKYNLHDDDDDEDSEDAFSEEAATKKKAAFVDDDEAAELIALSKKMLRKKSRQHILDQAYNRYNYPEDPSTLPKWFVEDEKRAIARASILTPEEVAKEKERIDFLRNRLPMKVIEAKYRKKKRLINKMQKARTQAEQIMANDSLTPLTRGKEVNKLYNKARRGAKDKRKKVVFMKRHASAAPRTKAGRKFRVVDKRLKKDVRAQKRIAKRKR